MKAESITTFDELVLRPARNPRTNRYDGKWWKTLVKLVFIVDGEEIIIPPGFLTNLGSIPKFLRWLVDVSDQAILGYILHDYIYGLNGPDIPQRKADKALFRISRSDGRKKLEAQLTWLGTYLFGWTRYKKDFAVFKEVEKDIITAVCEDNDFYPCPSK